MPSSGSIAVGSAQCSPRRRSPGDGAHRPSRIAKAQLRVQESSPYAGDHRDGDDRRSSSSTSTSSRPNGRTRSGGRAGDHQRPWLAAPGSTVAVREQLGSGCAGAWTRALRRGPQGCGLLQVPQPRDGRELDRFLEQPQRTPAIADTLIDASYRLGGRRHRRDPPVFTEFVSMISSDPNGAPAAAGRGGDRDYEGPMPSTSSSRRPRVYSTRCCPLSASRIWNALLQSAAAESASRRRAMKSASDNADELVKS